MRRLLGSIALLVTVITLACCAEPPPAAARINLTKPICSLAGLVSPLAGKVCTAAAHPGRLLGAGTQLLDGHLGGAANSLLGDGASGTTRAATTLVALAAIAASAVAGAHFLLHETAAMISSTTRPELRSTWFSAAYWRMAGISALLTLPFLFAAVIQALLRSELALLGRSAFGYLPLGVLAVAIAAPLTTLLLTASDQMSGLVSSASGGADTDFLIKLGAGTGDLSLVSRSPFIAVVVASLTIAAGLALWVELLIRAAAVYVIVLMLPLFFAALVWPARRVWAVRAVELLVALILSKFAIVAVLSLGGAALGHTTVPSFTSMLAGATLILLAAFAPWALLRILPLHELAAGAAAGLRHEPSQRFADALFGGGDQAVAAHQSASAKPSAADDRAADATMRRLAWHRSAESDSALGATAEPSSDDQASGGGGSPVPDGAGSARAGAPPTGGPEPALAEQANGTSGAAPAGQENGASQADPAPDGAAAARPAQSASEAGLDAATKTDAPHGLSEPRRGMSETWPADMNLSRPLHLGGFPPTDTGPPAQEPDDGRL